VDIPQFFPKFFLPHLTLIIYLQFIRGINPPKTTSEGEGEGGYGRVYRGEGPP